MRYILVLVTLVFFASCDSTGGKKESFSINGQSPENFYQTFVDSNKEDCTDKALVSDKPQIKIMLFNDRTFELTSANLGKVVGTWTVSNQAIALHTKEGVLATAEPYKTPTDLQITWASQQTRDKMGHMWTFVHFKDDLQCQKVSIFNDEETAQKMGTGKFETRIDPDARTMQILTAPREMGSRLFLLNHSKELFKFRNGKTIVEACGIEIDKANPTDKELLYNKYEILNQEAGVIDFDLPERGHPDEVYAKVEEKVESDVKAQYKMDINFTFIKEEILVDETLRENHPQSIFEALKQAAQTQPDLTPFLQAMEIYVPSQKGRKFRVNIGQLCDIAQNLVEFKALWISGEEQPQPVDLNVDRSSLAE